MKLKDLLIQNVAEKENLTSSSIKLFTLKKKQIINTHIYLIKKLTIQRNLVHYTDFHLEKLLAALNNLLLTIKIKSI
jgi:hypothetical protein